MNSQVVLNSKIQENVPERGTCVQPQLVATRGTTMRYVSRHSSWQGYGEHTDVIGVVNAPSCTSGTRDRIAEVFVYLTEMSVIELCLSSDMMILGNIL